jgi:hypothetical protein
VNPKRELNSSSRFLKNLLNYSGMNSRKLAGSSLIKLVRFWITVYLHASNIIAWFIIGFLSHKERVDKDTIFNGIAYPVDGDKRCPFDVAANIFQPAGHYINCYHNAVREISISGIWHLIVVYTPSYE